MTSLAFFLYDNRTWSPRWGRDWGLKAATGALADRPDLRADFDRYCGAMPSEQGRLSGFGEAIGGIFPRRGDGYLLCVALESSDHFGRPSWAAVGLWCPDPATLEQVLSAGDPVGSSRELLGLEAPPSVIEIRPANGVVEAKWNRRASSDPGFHRFAPKETVREVTSLLLGAVQSRARLPNVLGITATSRLYAAARAGFNLVYCHPMDERTERALAVVMDPREPHVDEAWPPPGGSTMPPASIRDSQDGPLQPPEARSRLRRLWPPLGIVGAVVIFLLQGDTRRDTSAISQDLSGPREVSIAVPEERSVEITLNEVGERLEEYRKLVPEALRQSPGFVAAETLEVMAPYQERRKRVRQAYTALIEIRARMVKRHGNYVAYYFDEAGRDAPPATRLQKVAAILGEAPLGGEDCRVLQEAFGFEFEKGNAILRRWCDSVEKLEKTAALMLPLGVPP
jgi:hypothetical protein